MAFDWRYAPIHFFLSGFPCVGDEVEFVILQNLRSRKFSATSVRKLSESQRPGKWMLWLEWDVGQERRKSMETGKQFLPVGERGGGKKLDLFLSLWKKIKNIILFMSCISEQKKKFKIIPPSVL